MPLFANPFSLEIPIRIGNLNIVFFVNENLYVSNTECISTPHNHHDFELRYTASGSCRQIIENETYIADAQNLLLVHPFEYHCQDQSSVYHESSQFNLRFSINPPDTSGKGTPERLYQNTTQILMETRYVHDSSGAILFYLQQLSNEVYQKKEGYIFNIRSLCLLIFIELMRLSNTNNIPLFPAEDIRYRGYDRTMIDEFFRQKYLTNITIGDLARDMKTSSRQVNRVLHKMFGMSFTQKLIEMRLQEVAHQIITTDKPLVTISRECGFKNYNYCFSCFKKAFHMSPKEFRALKRKN